MQHQEPNLERETPVALRGAAMSNDAFLRVIHSGTHEQLAVMTLPPDGETGPRVHVDADELYVAVDGTAEARVGDLVFAILPGDVVFVEAGTAHNIVNRAVLPLRLVCVYAPPAVPAGTLFLTREEATFDELGRPESSLRSQS